MRPTLLQEQLDAFLAYAGEGALLWDDPDGSFAGILSSLRLPDDVVFLREEDDARFELKCRLNGLGPDERALLYRSRRHRVEEGDWFAAIEACVACFEPMGEPDELIREMVGSGDTREASSATSAESGTDATRPSDASDAFISSASPAPACETAPSALGSSSLILDDGFGALRNRLEDDWYSLQAFRHAAGIALGGSEDLPDDILARQTGFKVYADCAVRDTWPSLTAYYSSLFQEPIVTHSVIPEAVRAAGTFKAFLFQRMSQGQLLDYDAESWICPSGLRELGIGPDDLRAFVDGAVSACDDDGVPYLTIPWLKGCAGADQQLLGYGFDDRFYESVLLMRRFALGRSTLCGRRLFSVRNASPRGRDFALALLKREGSMPVGELLDIIREDYAIPIAPAQVIQLVKSSGAYYREELDRAYVNRNQFIREME